MGSIEVGKDADLVIYDKFPLSDYAKVQKVLIDGQRVLRSRQGSERPHRETGREAEADREGKTEPAAGRRPAAAGGASETDRVILLELCSWPHSPPMIRC